MNIMAVYLAAGQSIRMGKDKLNLPTMAGPVGSLAFREVIRSRVEHTLVITGSNSIMDWMPERYTHVPNATKWTTIVCSDAWKGQGHSISEGVRQAQLRGAEAILIILADQPLVTHEMINEALGIFNDPMNAEADIVVTSYDGLFGPPVVFSKKLFPELLALEGDQGARRIVQGHHNKRLMKADPRRLMDIDTEEDYRRLVALHLE